MKGRIFITGISGSGKTSVARSIAQGLRIPYLSTGNFVRSKKDVPSIARSLQNGKLAPCEDDIRDFVSTSPDTCIIDGFPRSLDQYLWLSQLYAPKEPKVVVLGISRDTAIRRLEERGRENSDTIRKVINSQSLNFAKGYPIKVINAEATIQDVMKEVLKWIRT